MPDGSDAGDETRPAADAGPGRPGVRGSRARGGAARPPSRVAVVDGANVVGTRPDGWWLDRAGAARRLHESLITADVPFDEVVLVLEGAAKAGVRAGRDIHLRTVHAEADGDAAIRRQTAAAIGAGSQVVVITADRGLRVAVERIGARTMSPSWLLDQLE